MNLLTDLMREGNMKEFYKVANKVLMIRTNNPVVRKSGKASKERRRSLRIATLWRKQSPTTLK